jgi:hypothetical protein
MVRVVKRKEVVGLWKERKRVKGKVKKKVKDVIIVRDRR